MAFAVELLLTIVTVVIVYVFWNRQKLKNFPPGPRGFPLVGCLFSIKKPSHLYYKNLSKEYGSSVISIKLGARYVVVLNDWNSIKEMLHTQSELFAGRPSLFLWKATLLGNDFITTQSPFWKERKRFCLQYLRELGIGRHSIEEVIMDEVKKVMVFIEEGDKRRIDISRLFFTPILSIISKIIAGNTYEIDDKAMSNLREVIQFNYECFKNDSPLNFIPFLRHVPGLTNFAEFIESHRKVERLLQKSIDEHAETYVEGNTRDFIDIFLKEIIMNKDKNPSENPFKLENLLGAMYNLYNAAVQTTAHTLAFALLYMATWPEIQRKVQNELDQLLGNGRLPTYSDHSLLPYTEATILEVLRYTSVVPLSIPHAPLAAAQLCGYTIPKGTMVMPNTWAVHFDEDLWEDPQVFRPERFLNEDGKVHKPEYLHPFSLGARFCPGEPLTKMELFLFFTGLMQRFSFRCITGEVRPSLDPIAGISLRPQPFSLLMKLRE